MTSNRSFNWRVLDAIEREINERGITRAEVIARSGMRRNTFFAKMRGDTALTTDDIAKLAQALDCEPEFLLHRAVDVGPVGDTAVLEAVSSTRSRRESRTNFDLAAQKDQEAPGDDEDDDAEARD